MASVAGRRVALAVPTTYMNESGLAVRGLATRFGIEDPAAIVDRARRARPPARHGAAQGRWGTGGPQRAAFHLLAPAHERLPARPHRRGQAAQRGPGCVARPAASAQGRARAPAHRRWRRRPTRSSASRPTASTRRCCGATRCPRHEPMSTGTAPPAAAPSPHDEEGASGTSRAARCGQPGRAAAAAAVGARAGQPHRIGGRHRGRARGGPGRGHGRAGRAWATGVRSSWSRRPVSTPTGWATTSPACSSRSRRPVSPAPWADRWSSCRRGRRCPSSASAPRARRWAGGWPSCTR